ncbi:MAG: glycosyltransferase family 2 protein [Elainellaceae cyanobacterium]
MKLSVITVCRNAEATIERTLQGVLSQTYPDVEYIVADGQSSDRTLDIVHQYGDRLTKVISEPDSGIYAAMNKGIRLASGDWLYFANADDYLFDEQVFADVVQFLTDHPACDFVYGNHETRFPQGGSSLYEPAPPDRMLEEMVCLGNCFLQPASFFKASLFERLGEFNESYAIAADYDWFSRLLADPALTVCHLPRTIVSYAQGGTSSDIRALFKEVFEIQNKLPLYQREDWLARRMTQLQQTFIDKYARLEHTHQLAIAREQIIHRLEARLTPLEARLEKLEAENGELRGEIEAMKTSKFWKLRTLWFQVKGKLGLDG